MTYMQCDDLANVTWQVVEAEHAPEDTSRTPLKPIEAMISIDLSHPNIIHTYKYYTRIRQVLSCSLQAS